MTMLATGASASLNLKAGYTLNSNGSGTVVFGPGPMNGQPESVSGTANKIGPFQSDQIMYLTGVQGLDFWTAPPSGEASITVLAGMVGVLSLIEGRALTLTGAVGSAGTVQRYDSAGNAVGSAVAIAAGLQTLPAGSGTQRFLITCTAGSITSAVINASINSPQINGSVLIKPDGAQFHDVAYNSNTSIDLIMKAAVQAPSVTATPTPSETIPTLATGNRYYIDPIGGLDANNGTSPATPWQNLTKINGLNPGNGAIIHLASDGVFEYVDTIANYFVSANRYFPSNNCDNLRSTDPAVPIIVRPYNARPVLNSKPIIRWYAGIAAGDWTQETGIGPNIWSVPWTGTDTIYDYAIAYGPNDTLAIGAIQQVVGQAYSGNGTNPLQMKNPGDTTRANNKFYFYSVGNPTTVFGTVKFFGRNGVFSTSFNGLHNVTFDGLQFELTRAVTCQNAVGTSGSPVLTDTPVPTLNSIVKNCVFKKAFPGYWNNQNYYKNAAGTTVTPTECSMQFKNNYLEDIPYNPVRIRTGGLDGSTGAAGNSFSWEISGNRVYRSNLSGSNGGGLAYIQCLGGTKHHAWGNYGFDIRNGTGGNNVDGSFLYADIDAKNVVFANNIVEQSGIAYQLNCTQNGSLISNMAIDCIMHSLITGSNSNTYPTQSYKVIHNTWLWTGRVAPSSIQLSPGVNVTDWGVNTYVFKEYVDQNVGGNTAKSAVALLNNMAILASTSGFTSKKFVYCNSTAAQTSSFVGGGWAAVGFGSTGLTFDNGVDVTSNANIMSFIGSTSDAISQFVDSANGVAIPSIDGKVLGRGLALSVQYSDIRGRAFATVPTPGCYEPQS